MRMPHNNNATLEFLSLRWKIVNSICINVHLWTQDCGGVKKSGRESKNCRVSEIHRTAARSVEWNFIADIYLFWYHQHSWESQEKRHKNVSKLETGKVVSPSHCTTASRESTSSHFFTIPLRCDSWLALSTYIHSTPFQVGKLKWEQ